ncbi:hypothetical protein LRP50_11475 [Enterovibrio sp. ZSDZ42]|uniref:Uncharacterized protein n=1 Tax=Enterovibrio gelatinilyticus TaxID=2899819 RepID=A0ABT5R1X7_9GAMM|nr:hypothetical protein [Enterovibrio sp. ZSDZ42]MDD1793751.1 hypothetical protein [Enterovibrio sp. ZSDZ42]
MRPTKDASRRIGVDSNVQRRETDSELPPKVQIEIGVDELERLFVAGVLCASKFSCLNVESKRAVQSLCLNTCMHRVCEEETRKIGMSALKNSLVKSVIY